MYRYLYKFIYALIILFLFGCHVNKVEKQFVARSDSNWQQHIQKLKQYNSYIANGQIGYMDTKHRVSFNFKIQHHADKNYKIELFSNLVSDYLHIRVKPQHAEVRDHQNNILSDRDINKILLQHFNLNIPMEQLVIWLKGYIDLNYADYKVIAPGLLDSFSYSHQGNSWHISYLKYMPVGDIALPESIVITNDRQQPTKIKLKISSWQ